ncbi:MAG: ABC transporter ATP-binding protein [Oscillospiraceae bacterium]
MKRVFKQLVKFKWQMILIFITVLGASFSDISLPTYMAKIINQGVANADISYIWKIGAIMLCFSFTSMLCNIGTGFLSARISVWLGRDIRSQVFAKIESFSPAEIDRFSSASLITRTNNDILQLQMFMMMFLRIILMAPIVFIMGVVMSYTKSPSMSRVLLFSLPLQILLVFTVSKFAMPLSQSMQNKLDQVNLVMREKLTGIRVIRAFGTEHYESDRFKKANKDLTETTLKLQRTVSVMFPTLALIINFTIISILWIGGNKLPSGAIEAGDILAVTQYITQIMMSVTMLSMIFILYPRAAASAARVSEVLDTKPTITDPVISKSNPNQRGYLEFKNVSFTFPNAQAPALSGISFVAKPGETTAIIGSTGSGKTALVGLIPRFYDVSDGEILVDGINIKDYKQHDLRAKIGYVPQKALLFTGTIKDNISFGTSTPRDTDIINAARISQSERFIAEKEQGFYSHISQGGSNVSGGQRQRLSIARAIVRKPEIYIFDDSFSALDFKTDAALREALSVETKNATVIIVAQRVSTIMNSNRIIVLENGTVKGIGTHKELIKSCKTYEEIVQSQLSEEEINR